MSRVKNVLDDMKLGVFEGFSITFQMSPSLFHSEKYLSNGPFFSRVYFSFTVLVLRGYFSYVI